MTLEKSLKQINILGIWGASDLKEVKVKWISLAVALQQLEMRLELKLRKMLRCLESLIVKVRMLLVTLGKDKSHI